MGLQSQSKEVDIARNCSPTPVLPWRLLDRSSHPDNFMAETGMPVQSQAPRLEDGKEQSLPLSSGHAWCWMGRKVTSGRALLLGRKDSASPGGIPIITAVGL